MNKHARDICMRVSEAHFEALTRKNSGAIIHGKPHKGGCSSSFLALLTVSTRVPKAQRVHGQVLSAGTGTYSRVGLSPSLGGLYFPVKEVRAFDGIEEPRSRRQRGGKTGKRRIAQRFQ